MQTHCSCDQLEFEGFDGHKVVAGFDGGAITSDAGALLLRHVDKAVGLFRRVAAGFIDRRDRDCTVHSVQTLVGQRIAAIALGYEDVDDHDTLRHDPVLALLSAPAIMPSVAAMLRSFTKPGDGVIVQSPVYSPYFEAIHGSGRRLLVNRLRLENNRYELDVENFEKLAADGAKAFLLCNPHNPAGKAWTREELTALNNVCERYGVLVISDDIHCDIRLSDRPHIVFSSLSEDAAEKSFICTAPTKTFNLAGVPSATVSVANKERREALLATMRASFMVNANFFGRLALEVAYSTGAPWVDQLTGYIDGNVELVLKFAEDRLPGITPMRPDASFLVWLDACELDRKVGGVQQFFVDRAGVNLYDGRVYGPGGEGFIRLNVGCPRPLLRRGLERMSKAVASL